MRVFHKSFNVAGTGPRATVKKRLPSRRARACPSPCIDREENGVGRWTIFVQVERSRVKPSRMRVWQARAPALRFARPSPFTVGRGPVPRHASVGRKTALAGVRFSRRSNARGGQAPALRYARPYPFTVGRGPVPRHASVKETAWVCVRFLCGSTIAGDRPPRYGDDTIIL